MPSERNSGHTKDEWGIKNKDEKIADYSQGCSNMDHLLDN
jgi:hypothetical protein